MGGRYRAEIVWPAGDAGWNFIDDAEDGDDNVWDDRRRHAPVEAPAGTVVREALLGLVSAMLLPRAHWFGPPACQGVTARLGWDGNICDCMLTFTVQRR